MRAATTKGRCPVGSDPEDIFDEIETAGIVDQFPDALGDKVTVGWLRDAVLIGVSGSPVILDTPGLRDRFAKAHAEAERRAEAYAGAVARAVTPGQAPSAPKVYYACCIHCEHNGESDPDLDDERHPNPCPDGCHAVTPGQAAGR
jgi:hypothetical protein